MARRRVASPHPRRVLIAPDKFKGTLTSDQAARAIERGLRRAWPGVKTTRFTLTDGGDGFVEFMVRVTKGKFRHAETLDAAGRPIRAKWGVLGDGKTAVIGLTEASGIAHLPPRLRNPEKTSNLGTGNLLAFAAQEGFREILVGLGGSATTEAGLSLATPIGYNYIDKDHRQVAPIGANLLKIDRILAPSPLPKSRFIVATDVENPLFGPRGAAFQFGPQKGADPAMVRRLDKGLRHVARIVKRDLGYDLANEPGAGAAGGCGYGLMAFFDARREDGFQLVRRLTKLDDIIAGHDLVITGEGAFDRTSLHGKAPSQLAVLARQLKRPAWALCGRVDFRGKSPFAKLAGLSTPEHPGPRPESLTSAQHGKRLERLAYEVGRSYTANL
ncbi:MAG TPA: glycerate kinase [Candidatus Methylacidiphilales bacterium]|nr:glycerate kinase [Candidatus Methylacidiphilales bacterium]